MYALIYETIQTNCMNIHVEIINTNIKPFEYRDYTRWNGKTGYISHQMYSSIFVHIRCTMKTRQTKTILNINVWACVLGDIDDAEFFISFARWWTCVCVVGMCLNVCEYPTQYTARNSVFNSRLYTSRRCKVDWSLFALFICFFYITHCFSLPCLKRNANCGENTPVIFN